MNAAALVDPPTAQPDAEPDIATPPPSSPAPRSSSRLVGLDIARGLAVIGMITAHVGITSENLGTYEGWLGFAHGRSSILFATLAGVSLGILTGGRNPYRGVAGLQARTRVLVRAAMLVAVGGLLAVLSTPVALILAYYAAWFVIALPFVRLRARTLLIAGAAAGILGAVAHLYLLDLATRLGFYGSGDANSLLPEVMIFGVYPGAMWMGFVLVGLGLSKLDLRSTATLARVLVVGILVAAAGYGASAALSHATGITTESIESGSESGSGSFTDEFGDTYLEDGTVIYATGETMTADGTLLNADGTSMTPDESDAFLLAQEERWESIDTIASSGPSFDSTSPAPDARMLLLSSPHSSTPFEFLGSGGVALAVIALCLLAPLWLQRALLPLAAVGSMSLTAYSLHVVAIYIWPDFFMSQESNLPLLVMAAGAVVICTIWSLTLGRGPLERLVRSASMRAARLD